MSTVTSKDGTIIAFDQPGKGPALILVGGMFEQRAMDSETAKLAVLPLLAENFTVFHYDRRGRGDSMDTLPFAVEREIEDIEASSTKQVDWRSCSVSPPARRLRWKQQSSSVTR